MIQQNRQMNSEMPNKSQNDLVQAEQQPANNTSQVGAGVAISQSSMDSAVVVPVSSAIAAPQWKSSEPAVYDSNIPNSAIQAGSVGSPSLTNSSGTEPTPPSSQGLGPRQLSGSLPSHGHNVGAQWQQSQQQTPSQPIQQSPTLPPSSQQYMKQEQQPEQKSPQNQLPLQQQPQQQKQHLQAGQGSLYLRPANSKPE